jgi:hypothetical protein
MLENRPKKKKIFFLKKKFQFFFRKKEERGDAFYVAKDKKTNFTTFWAPLKTISQQAKKSPKCFFMRRKHLDFFLAPRSQFHQRFLHTFFVQKSFLCLEFGFEQTFVQKTHAKNVDDIDTRKERERVTLEKQKNKFYQKVWKNLAVKFYNFLNIF